MAEIGKVQLSRFALIEVLGKSPRQPCFEGLAGQPVQELEAFRHIQGMALSYLDEP